MHVKITHSVYFAELNCRIDLQKLTENNINVIYSKTPFEVVKFRHRKILGSCLIYKNGKIIVHTPTKTSVRKFARIIEQCGFKVKLKKIELLTQSGVYHLKSKVNINKLVTEMRAEYNPEIFHASYFKRDKLNFIVYNSGVVVITGIKGEKSLHNVVYPTLYKLEML